ncbi:DoxX-like family protein [Salipaludibacillus sp. HK11]|uniref:DoxX-like family protein n=1 Tax=Salipaludibacillus sp. HK11 TaxID=3394320 RepID=UPI0039FDACF1
MSANKPIYVKTNIQTDIESLWKFSQNPQLHQRWDLRFSAIDYLQKEKPTDDQHFLYRTNIGLGLSIHGTGISRGEMSKENGERTSSLQFFSDHPLSFIKQGSGYWKYKPNGDSVEFLTQYNYEVKGGKAGGWIDKRLFKPLIGWATSWSFDALKLWLEKGIQPEETIRKSLIHFLVCFSLAFVWMYQGLVPKLLFPETGEIEMVKASGIFSGYESGMVTVIGVAQMLIGLLFLLPIKKKWLFLGSSVAVFLLGIGPLIISPEQFILPFNPASLNMAMIVIGIIGALNCKNLALARHCKRRKEKIV